MAQQTENAAIDRLAVFVGEWSVAAKFKDLPPADKGARVVFEWMAGRRFLIQRWEVPAPHAPDGIAIWLREAHRQLEAQRWQDPPPIPRSRAERLRLGARFLEDELAAECRGNKAYEDLREHRRLHDKRNLGGPTKPYTPPGIPAGEVNLTDPDSRRMKGNRRYIQGYNAQAVVNEQQIVLAAEITTNPTDWSQLGPMLETAMDELQQVGVTYKPDVVVADAQYSSITSSPTTGSRCSSRPTRANARERDPGGPAAGTHSCAACSPPTWATRSTANDRNRSSRCSVTPSTTARSTGFNYRGRSLVRTEWRLAMLTHNLTKLHRHQVATAPG